MPLTRRSLLKSASAAALHATLRRKSFALTEPAETKPLAQLAYNQVTLLPSPLRTQFDQTHALFLGLDTDMLLKPFRQASGLPAPGDDMGGWYSRSRFFNTHNGSDGFVPGHTFGQYLSALARASAITGDPATRQKVDALVQGIAPTLTPAMWDGYHLPAYTFDKLCCGLSDAYAFSGIEAAKPALAQNLAVSLPRLPEKALSRPEQRARPHLVDADTWDETYTLPENLFLAFQRTGNPAYKEAAIRFLEDDLLFNPLAQDIDVLPGEHAYSHVNALSSAMQAYFTLSSEKHLRAAKNAFRIVQAQSFATGGWGPGETLLRPHTDDLARSIFSERNSFETPCGAYAHFKITRALLRVTRDPAYGDSMERVLYNTVLGAKPILEDGSTFYYSDYSTSGRKNYHPDKWPCCSGTLPQIAADYGISAYFTEPRALYVNLYIPSKVTWQQAGTPITLTQETAYPYTPTTRLTIAAATRRDFTLNLRIPAWSGHATRILINGKATPEQPQPGTFHALTRSWRSGDTVEVAFDMPLRLETLELKEATLAAPIKAEPAMAAPSSATTTLPNIVPSATPLASTPATTVLAALMRGPLVYMATGPWPIEMTGAQLLAATANPSGEALSVATDAHTIVFKPFPLISEELYRTYQPLKQG